MKSLIILFTLPLIMLSCAPKEQETESSQSPAIREKVTDGVFIHLSHGPEDPHRVLMALRMAEMMAENKDVLVYFDIKAVHVVIKDAENITMEGKFPNSQEQLANLIEMGVELQVCPGCLNAAGKTEEDVMEGVNMANKESFFNFTDGRILSIDY